MSEHQIKRRALRAFTLVELLVVVGIIGVLVAILLPALQRARHQAVIVSCASQLHQMYIGLVMYDNDWHDTPMQNPWGGTARETTGPFYTMITDTMRASWEKTAWCPSQTYNAYGMGYHYYGNYTFNPGFWAPYTGPYQRRPIRALHATAQRAQQQAGGTYCKGRWLFMADRMQLPTLDPTYYDMDVTLTHTNGATGHVLNNGVTGANLLWDDGSVQWRSMDPKYRHQPMPPNVSTGPEGWVHLQVPYTDAVVATDTIDITITWFTPNWQVLPNYGGSSQVIAGF